MLDHLDAAPHIALGVLEGLAQLVGDDLGQLVMMLLEQMLIAEHQAGTGRHRRVAPALEGLLGVVQRFIKLTQR